MQALVARQARWGGLAVGLVSLVLSTACGGPTSPAAGPTNLASEPVSPANGSVVPYFGDLRMVARNATSPDGAVVLLTFELDTTDRFSDPFFVGTTPQAAGAETDLSVQLSFSRAREGQRVFWRVRAGAGETTGTPSRPYTFTVGPRTDSPDVLFAEPPEPVSPSNGADQPANPMLVARETAHSSGPTLVWFYWARDPAFATQQSCGDGRLLAPGLHYCSLSRLEPGTYYWRAQTSTTRAGSSHAQGLRSAYSPASSFTVQPVDIRRAEFVTPARGDVVHPRPTITVTNASRTGDVGPVAYRLSILTEALYGTGRTVMTATVPEGAGQTSWTLPQDLAVETRYFATSVAIDTRTGFEGIATQSPSFLVVPRSWTLRQLQVDTSCGFAVEKAASQGDFAGSAIRVRTSASLSIDLIGSGPGKLSGTIGGVGQYVGVTGILGGSPAQTEATLGSDGALRGTFSGVVSTPNAIGWSECRGSGFSWTLR